MDDRQPRYNLCTTTIFLSFTRTFGVKILKFRIILPSKCVLCKHVRTMSLCCLIYCPHCLWSTNQFVFLLHWAHHIQALSSQSPPFLSSTDIPLFTRYPRVLMAAKSRSCALGRGKINLWKSYFSAQDIFTNEIHTACHHTLNYF